MSDITNLVNMKPITQMHIVKLPNGKFGYVGNVPAELYYIDPTPELLRAAKFGERFGPNRRTFKTMEEAQEFAEENK